MFVMILVVGLAAGTIDRSAARRWGQRLTGPDRDQRLEALARLARLDHLALIARRSLINVLDDDRLPAGAADVGRMLTALVPGAVSDVHLDLSPDSIAGRATAILWSVVPLDYAGFHAELQRQRVSVRRRAAGLLGSLGARQPFKSLPAITILAQMVRDPDPGVRRAAYEALQLIWQRIVSAGVKGRPRQASQTAFVEALVSLDPVITTKAFMFFRGYGLPSQFVAEAFYRAWAAWLQRSTRRR